MRVRRTVAKWSCVVLCARRVLHSRVTQSHFGSNGHNCVPLAVTAFLAVMVVGLLASLFLYRTRLMDAVDMEDRSQFTISVPVSFPLHRRVRMAGLSRLWTDARTARPACPPQIPCSVVREYQEMPVRTVPLHRPKVATAVPAAQGGMSLGMMVVRGAPHRLAVLYRLARNAAAPGVSAALASPPSAEWAERADAAVMPTLTRHCRPM